MIAVTFGSASAKRGQLEAGVAHRMQRIVDRHGVLRQAAIGQRIGDATAPVERVGEGLVAVDEGNAPVAVGQHQPREIVEIAVIVDVDPAILSGTSVAAVHHERTARVE